QRRAGESPQPPATEPPRRRWRRGGGCDEFMLHWKEVARAALDSDKRSSFDDRHIGEETVAPPSDSLHEPGARRRIAERLPNPVDGFVHSVVEIDEGVGGPQAITKLVPGHGLARPFEQHRQNLKRLLLKSQPHALLPQLAGT